MKKIEIAMVCAINTCRNKDLGNTRIVSTGNYSRVYLFNNLIAEIDVKSCYVTVYTMYKSATTKSRLNAILQNFCYPKISQTDWVWKYADGTPCHTDRTFGVHDMKNWGNK